MRRDDEEPDNLSPSDGVHSWPQRTATSTSALWANLNAKGSAIADLGIGFVQNFDGSGMTERQGIGSATFNGDWVAAVRRQYASDAEAGAIRWTVISDPDRELRGRRVHGCSDGPRHAGRHAFRQRVLGHGEGNGQSR